MLCAPLDWQYAELPSSASDAVLCSVLVRKMSSNQIEEKKEKKIPQAMELDFYSFFMYCFHLISLVFAVSCYCYSYSIII